MFVCITLCDKIKHSKGKGQAVITFLPNKAPQATVLSTHFNLNTVYMHRLNLRVAQSCRSAHQKGGDLIGTFHYNYSP